MKHICPHCGFGFTGTIECDNLGWHTSCPICEQSFDVDTQDSADVLKAALIGYLKSNKTNHRAHDTTDLEESTFWKQARDMFVSLALLLNCSPDTSTGDILFGEIYTEADLEQTVAFSDLNYFLWDDLT